MNTTTAAQRHNARQDKIWEAYRAQQRLVAAAPALLEALRDLEESNRIAYAHLCAVQERTPGQREEERLIVARSAQSARAAITAATGGIQ